MFLEWVVFNIGSTFFPEVQVYSDPAGTSDRALVELFVVSSGSRSEDFLIIKGVNGKVFRVHITENL